MIPLGVMDTAPCETISGERVGNMAYASILPGVFENIPLRTVDAAWRTSDFGRYFRHQQLRYTARYDIPEIDALQLLGPDTCPQGHQDEFTRYVGLIVDAEERAGTALAIGESDKALLYFVAKFHDIGELTHPDLVENGLKPVGDIPFGLKTPEDRQEESRVRKFLFSQTPFEGIDPDFLARAEAIMAHDHETFSEFGDTTAHLHEIYEAAHDIQSIDTALRARFAVEHADLSPELRQELKRLADKVTNDHSRRLVERSSYFAITPEILRVLRLPGHFVTEENQFMHETCTPRTVLPLGTCIKTCVRLQSR